MATPRPSFTFPRSSFLSQCRQDRWAFDNVFNPLGSLAINTFVEFGARDGRRNSNSFFFEKSLGWSGLLLEAGIDDIPALRKNRKCRFEGQDSCVHAGVAAVDGESLLHQTFCGSANRTRKCRSDERLILNGSEARGLPGVRQVPSVSLNATLSRLGMRGVGLLSADCEGCEWDALSGFDWARFAPQLVIVERSIPPRLRDASARHETTYARLRRLLYSYGYLELLHTPKHTLDGYFVSKAVVDSGRLPQSPCMSPDFGCEGAGAAAVSVPCAKSGVWGQCPEDELGTHEMVKGCERMYQ